MHTEGKAVFNILYELIVSFYVNPDGNERGNSTFSAYTRLLEHVDMFTYAIPASPPPLGVDADSKATRA